MILGFYLFFLAGYWRRILPQLQSPEFSNLGAIMPRLPFSLNRVRRMANRGRLKDVYEEE